MLRPITKEEQKILKEKSIQKNIYTTTKEFTIDSKKMLAEGKLISIRPHTRFTSFPRHKHNYIEIIYMCCGQTTHIINGEREILLCKGDLLFLNQHCYHQIKPAGENDIAINFVVMPEFFDVAFDMMHQENAISDFIISSLKTEEKNPLYLHFKVADIPAVENLVENLVWGIFAEEENDLHIMQLTMGLLFVQLLKYTDTLEDSSGGRDKRIIAMKAVKYVEENYKEANLSFLAQTLGLSVSSLSKIIKVNTGFTFKELLQNKRLSRSAALLSENSLSVTDIIFAVGYDNTSYFHRIFKEKYKMSPLEYRKQFGK